MTATDGHVDNGLDAGADDFGPNQWMVEQMFRQFQQAPASVSPAWQEFFAGFEPSVDLFESDDSAEQVVEIEARVDPGPPAATTMQHPQTPTAAAPSHLAALDADHAQKMIGVTARIAEAMDASLEVPTATSVRSIPAKLLEVNRLILNNQLRRRTDGGKVSFTHLIGWAVIQALKEMPELNVSYREIDGVPHRITPRSVNLGLAVDTEGRGGERVLIVPNIKDADQMDFQVFWETYEALIRRVRSNQITPEDFAGTTVSLTNPGMIGTVQSVPG